MENKTFTKLSSLVDSEFTIEKVEGYKFKKWDTETGRMLSEDNYFEGSQKKYQVETDKGLLDLSEGQLGTIFVKVQHAGQANVIGATVAVKSNGKTGIDIRYYLNAKAVRPAENASQGNSEESSGGGFDWGEEDRGY